MKKTVILSIIFLALVALFSYSVHKYGWQTAGTDSLAIFLDIIQVVTLFFTGWQLVISYLGLRKRKPYIPNEPKTRFAVLVAAHNEQEVVGQIVDNLSTLDYPKEMYDVYVICDNCTDNTAKIVREHGGIAMERHEPEKRGKGYGLEWMFENLWRLEREEGKAYDAVVMFDADNLASKNFLQVMNTKIMEGSEVIQGYLDSKNPNDTWVTKAYSFAYWSTNRTFQLSRENIGMSAQLGGTGVVVTTKVLKEFGWGATSLTEDLEFTQRYLLGTGKRVAWAHDAKIYDEKPLGIKASWKQRIRWMQGHADCMVRYSIPLMKEGFKKRSIKHLDSAIYLLQPSRVVLSVILLFFAFLSFFNIGVSSFMFNPHTSKFIYLPFVASYFILPFLGMFLEKKFKEAVWFPIAYLFSITWSPIIIIGLIKRKEKVWSHTKHTRKLNEDDIKKLDV